MKLPRPVRLTAKGLTPRDYRDVPILTPDNHVWEKSTFTVPASVSEERVQFCADRYQKKFGEYLEAKGFAVLFMEKPYVDKSLLAFGMTPPDRRAYVMYAKVRRAPQVFRVEVPDEDVPVYLESGFALA